MPAIFDILPTPAESPWSYTLVPVIIICSIIGFYYKPFFYKLLLHPYEICRGKRWHTLFTSALVHRSWIHLLVNVVLIYALLYDLFGLIKQEHGVITANICSFLFIVGFISIPNILLSVSKKNDFTFTAVGASGLTFALYGFSAMFFPLESRGSFLIKVVKNSGQYWLYFLAIILCLSFIKSLSINRKLHLVAFIIGSVCVYLIRPSAFIEFCKSLNF
ncbi:rhomboid family intramembrane serine protease [Sphingobacterium spiritivorum]|uniref:rhomboid family intramembrane serine protease n=1 Tax=Sphingobacterium spiritivorum TaxID=258 RepID=UPI003DA348F7